MTRLPVEMESIENVSNAKRLMELFGIRHVPVMRGSGIFGIVSQRDLLNAEMKAGHNIDDQSIDDICQKDVLAVPPMMPVDEVAQKMLDRRVGSAVVKDGGFVVGIYTSSDAFKTLCQVFGKRKSSST